MAKLKIGAFADCFRLSIRDGIFKAAELGLQGVQVFTTHGELAPENLTGAKRQDFRMFVEKIGLEISATCTDYGVGFVDAERNRDLITKVKANIDLAVDLGVGIITTHIGAVPENEKDPVWTILLKALNEIGKHADKKKVVLATETGTESGKVLRKLLDKLDTKAIRVNFDPANLVMNKFNHFEAIRDLAPFIVHTHAKDGKRGDGEVPLGAGDVDFPKYVRALNEIGFKGYYTIERECGDNPAADIRNAAEFLRNLKV